MTRHEMTGRLLRGWRLLESRRRLNEDRLRFLPPKEGGKLLAERNLIRHFQTQAATAIAALPPIRSFILQYALCGGHTYEQTAERPEVDGRQPLTILRTAKAGAGAVSRLILLTDEELSTLCRLLPEEDDD